MALSFRAVCPVCPSEGTLVSGACAPVLAIREASVAQKIRVELVCDACEDGRPAQRTLGFAFDDENGDRSEYKIELCARHMAQFVGALQQWIEMARLEPLITTKSGGRG